MVRTGKPAQRTVAAVERAMVVLDAFLETPELGTNEIARRTGIGASTVSRILATLASGGFVAYNDETGRYRLGSRLMVYGNLVHSRLDTRQALRPLLEILARRTGETTTLSAPSSPDAVMRKTPISSTLPNRFLVARSTRKSSDPSPSK